MGLATYLAIFLLLFTFSNGTGLETKTRWDTTQSFTLEDENDPSLFVQRDVVPRILLDVTGLPVGFGISSTSNTNETGVLPSLFGGCYLPSPSSSPNSSCISCYLAAYSSFDEEWPTTNQVEDWQSETVKGATVYIPFCLFSMKEVWGLGVEGEGEGGGEGEGKREGEGVRAIKEYVFNLKNFDWRLESYLGEDPGYVDFIGTHKSPQARQPQQREEEGGEGEGEKAREIAGEVWWLRVRVVFAKRVGCVNTAHSFLTQMSMEIYIDVQNYVVSSLKHCLSFSSYTSGGEMKRSEEQNMGVFVGSMTNTSNNMSYSSYTSSCLECFLQSKPQNVKIGKENQVLSLPNPFLDQQLSSWNRSTDQIEFQVTLPKAMGTDFTLDLTLGTTAPPLVHLYPPPDIPLLVGAFFCGGMVVLLSVVLVVAVFVYPGGGGGGEVKERYSSIGDGEGWE